MVVVAVVVVAVVAFVALVLSIAINLGCGGFGAVELVCHATTGETYALKV